MLLPRLDSRTIVALRPPAERPQAGVEPLNLLRETEPVAPSGNLAQVLTVMLRGSECSFRCLMCDLWKSTHVQKTSPGAIAAQVEWALQQRVGPESSGTTEQWIKLYNASNFFAPVNVPSSDLRRVAHAVRQFQRVIVENHPKILPSTIEQFRSSIGGRLEVAMGLETIHPDILPALNKQMNVQDFRVACEWLQQRDIDIRVFVLLRPPGLTEGQGVEWCCKSVELALASGARQVSVIPVRAGNGAIEYLQAQGHFEPPLARSLEIVLAQFAGQSSGVVTADLWDWDKLRGVCPDCSPIRYHALELANRTQTSRPLQSAAQESACACPKLDSPAA